MSDPEDSDLPLAQAILAELATCSIDGIGELQMWFLVQRVRIESGHDLLLENIEKWIPLFTQHGRRCEEIAYGAYVSIARKKLQEVIRKERADKGERLTPFVRFDEDLPLATAVLMQLSNTLTGDEFHLVRFLKRVAVTEQHEVLIDAVRERKPYMKIFHHEGLCDEAIASLERKKREVQKFQLV